MMNFRKNNISVIAVLPAFTQCYDGTKFGLLELYFRNPPQQLYPNLSWTDRKTLARVDNCPQAGTNCISNLMHDYIKYLSIMNEKFYGSKQFDYAYRYVTNPCHQDTQHLKYLVELLYSVNNCPEVVYMDMDLTYITSYSLEVLHMTISFGINLVDQCVDIDNSVAEILSTDHSQIVLNFLINQSIVDKDTHIAITS
ncbi:unnamed protein product [Adineta steineri]|uniref:Uncharacterized protein n=1 Tax=Adineta steineri TaxID=433720 RepID=A0A815QHV6_9BILA|nr:unnamed protein product [Adineta steineri]CAF1633633.1 unnamed protein product [Adineta steineri]